MYNLVKTSENSEQKYDIVLSSTKIGVVSHKNDKWTATIGSLTLTRKTRKKAVEGLLTQIILEHAEGI